MTRATFTIAAFLCSTMAGRSHDALIRVYDEAGNVIETHEHKGDFKEPIVPAALIGVYACTIC